MGCQGGGDERSDRKHKKYKHFLPSRRLTTSKVEPYTGPMTSRRWSASAALLASLAFVAPVFLSAQAQQRAVYASAVGQNGAPVPGLGIPDFVVREDKVAREILNVAPAADPMQVALLVDNSQAADPYVREIREGLTAFIAGLGADPTGAKHQVAVITIGERPTINTDYTTDLERATKGAQRIFAQPNSGAYLLDGIIETSQGIKKRGSTRPVIVAVVTAGVELSDRPYQSALEPLMDSGAAFHVMVVGRPISDGQDRMMALDLGTKNTGGRYDTVLAASGLASRLKQVAEELTHQYKITYARPTTLIPPEQVTVAAAKPGLVVRGIAQRPAAEGDRR